MNVVRDLDCGLVEERDLVRKYLAGGLPEEEAEAFEKHYFGCESCWSEVRTGNEIRAALNPASAPAAGTVPSGSRSWRLLAAAAVVAACAAAGLLIWQRSARSPVDVVLAAAPPTRRVEARLAGMPYRALEPVTRGTTEESKPWRLLKAREEALESIKRRPGAEAWRAAGLAELLMGDAAEASATLNRGVQVYPRDVELLNDLAAARLAQFSATGSFENLRAAFSAAKLAVKGAPRFPEAQFNLALVAQYLGLSDTAALEWKRYLELDASSPWASEAREHLRAVSAKPLSERWLLEKEQLLRAARDGRHEAVEASVARFPVFSRALLVDEILPAWAAATEGNDGDELVLAREMAAAWRAATSDPLLLESVEVIERARHSHSSRTIAMLKDGHRAYGAGRSRQEESRFSDARASFERAEALLASAGSPFRWAASYEIASCRFDSNELSGALETLRPISEVSRRLYPFLYARTQWLAGLTETCRGHPAESLYAYQEALATFRGIGSRGGESAILCLLAEVYEEIGETELGGNDLRASLVGIPNVEEPVRRYLALSLAGEIAQAAGELDLARAAYFDAAQAARQSKKPDSLAYVLLLLARVENAAGNRTAAEARLGEAVSVSASIPDPGVRERSNAEVQVARGEIASRPGEAIQELSSAERFFRGRGDLGRLETIYLARGTRYLAERDTEKASRDFLDGVDAAERERRALPQNESMRISLFERSREVFEKAVSLLAEEGRIEQAADVLELARARTLFESVSGARETPRPGDAARLARKIPARTAVLEYEALPERVLTFVFRADGVRLAVTEAKAGRVEALVASSQDRGFAAEAAGDLARTELYRLLVAPAESLLDGVDTLVFVPDEALHGVAFAALRSPTTGRYLVEDYGIGVAPSVGMFVRASERDGVLAREPSGVVLVVANPRFDRRLAGRLALLPGAEDEARAVAASRPASVLLAGEAATKASFIDQLSRATVVHFAGHAISDGRAVASLAFTPEMGRDETGLLYADEIARLDLSHIRLVVLSACETARGPTRGAEGVMSLARAFLAAGVPIVLATLAPVDDRAAAAILGEFHRRLGVGGTVFDALRRSQLEALRNGDPLLRMPSAWGAFQIVGGSRAS